MSKHRPSTTKYRPGQLGKTGGFWRDRTGTTLYVRDGGWPRSTWHVYRAGWKPVDRIRTRGRIWDNSRRPAPFARGDVMVVTMCRKYLRDPVTTTQLNGNERVCGFC